MEERRREGEREEEGREGGREDAVSALQVGMRRAGWRDTATHEICEKTAQNAK